MDFGRIAAQSAKQVIMQKVREAERLRQYEEFKDRVGEIINGIVKRTEYGNVIVDVGRGEAILRRDQLIQREAFRNGDRVRALIREVRHETRGPQIFLSRTAPEFLAELFKMEVPEIYDGIIEIKAVARDPGSRAKMGVISYDSSIDPVGACVGMRGCRVQAVVTELQGEKIDIIPWNQDPATFLVNALQPAEVSKVVFDDDSERIEVVVPDEQLSLAIGRRGQNVRLASQLTGFDIDIMTEAQESERRQAEFAERTQLLHGDAERRRDGGAAAGRRGLRDARGGRLRRPRRAHLDRRLRPEHRRGAAGPRPREPRGDQRQGARARARARRRAEPLRLRGPDAADDRDAGRGRHQDARGLRPLRRLGARRRLHHRRRQAGEGHRAAREVRHEPRGGADAGDERPRPARLGRSGGPRRRRSRKPRPRRRRRRTGPEAR